MSKPTVEQDAQFAAEYAADVTVEKIAEVYAEALLNAVDTKKESSDDAIAEFDSLVRDVLDRNEKFDAILKSVVLQPDVKLGVVDRVFAGKTSATFLSFLKVLAKHGRLDLLRAIHSEFHKLNDKRKGRIPVVVTTASEMPTEAFAGLADRLRTKLGGEPIIRNNIDPNVIGGIVIRIGDTIYDASIATQLLNVRQNMVDRSAHEIQSRRDRFRNTEGN